MMHTNPQIISALSEAFTIEQIKEKLAWNLSQWQKNGFGLWMFYLQGSNEWVGRGGLRRIIIDGAEQVELNYVLLPNFWQQGFATEIGRACCEIAFEVFRLDQIVAFTALSNKASQRVMQKLGFEFEKEILHDNTPCVLYRLSNPRVIELTPYDQNWPVIFREAANRIKQVLGNDLQEIYHIGSTAIPDMPAKPIIDLLLVCENLDFIERIAQQLNTLNYLHVRRHIIPHRIFFTSKQDADIAYNLHICERGDPQINRHVNFRDYLIHHIDESQAYAQLKKELSAQYPKNILRYVIGKSKLVQAIDAKAKCWQERKKDYLSSNTGIDASNWSQIKLLQAMEANLNVHMTHFAQYINQVDLIRIPGSTIVNSGLRDDTFNYVLDADFTESEARQKICDVTDYFKKTHAPFSWWISPTDKPANLPIHLAEAEYVNTENNTAMYFDLDAWNGSIQEMSELKIVRALDAKTLQDFALVLTNDRVSFQTYFSWIAGILTEEDPIEYYVGYVNDKPVVRGLSCYFAQVVGLHWLSTAPDERKKGYGKAMQEFRLKRAKDLRYHIAVLQASVEGYPLYKKLGYLECGNFREFKLMT
jgi:GrpB-like predicted nucleotidyltransferase (UPF0157 family)/GNAT superfamily N-acetyltransferase